MKKVEKMRSSQHSNYISLFERIIVLLNYITYGLVGFVYVILTALKKCRLTPFLQYHIFLTFFVIILYWLVTVLISFIVQILSFIPFINTLVIKLLFYFNAPIFGTYSFIATLRFLALAYLCITSFAGAYSYIPWVSNIIRQNVRR